MRKSYVILGVLAALGCQPDSRQADVTMQSTTHPAAGRPPARRHVDLMVRDASAVEFASTLIGRECRVQLRPDALGMAGSAPTGLAGRWAAQGMIDGKIEQVTDQWVAIDGADSKRKCIPLASILMIELKD